MIRAVAVSLFAALLVSGCNSTAYSVGVLPDLDLTPGAVRTTDRDAVCADRHTRQYRHWSREQADRILKKYGLPTGAYGLWFEIDHLIPLSLGGADTDDNLWPEPRRSIEPSFNAETKDYLEWKLADMVCSGQLDLVTAQEAIRDTWIDAYREYVGELRDTGGNHLPYCNYHSGTEPSNKPCVGPP